MHANHTMCSPQHGKVIGQLWCSTQTPLISICPFEDGVESERPRVQTQADNHAVTTPHLVQRTGIVYVCTCVCVGGGGESESLCLGSWTRGMRRLRPRWLSVITQAIVPDRMECYHMRTRTHTGCPGVWLLPPRRETDTGENVWS